MFELPKKMFALPTYRESVDQAVSAENLKALAANTTDPEVLLGLTALVRTGDPVRREISEMAVKTRPAYSPMAAVLAVMLDGIDEESIGDLVRRDPDNALGHYLQGALLHQSDREDEAMVAFRKAAHCSELRLYESTTGPALFKALDALKLAGADRLCALSWMASRSSDFSSAGLQPIKQALFESARLSNPDKREEIFDLLVTLAGHLYATNFTNRWFAQRALECAFLLKAEIAPNGSPMMHGYAAAASSLFSAACKWPGFEEEENPLDVARFLPSRIHQALATEMNRWAYDMEPKLSDQEKAAFEKARETAAETAKALINLVATDPDGIVGAYLKGLPPSRHTEGIWALQRTFVGKVMEQRPDVLRAAVVFKKAMSALWKASENDPERKNAGRMLEIGWAITSYAQAHDNAYPNSIDLLFEKGHLQPPLVASSLLTGRPYGYVAAGEKQPAKTSDAARLVLLYDDNECQGCYQCFSAVGVLTSIRVDELKEQLRKRGKLVP